MPSLSPSPTLPPSRARRHAPALPLPCLPCLPCPPPRLVRYRFTLSRDAGERVSRLLHTCSPSEDFLLHLNAEGLSGES